MTATLTIRDESTSGQTIRSTTIELPSEQVTVEQLIRSYVFQEVKDSNAKRASGAAAIPDVEPTLQEVALNGSKLTTPIRIDWRVEFDKTKQAFRKRQILVFINDKQMDSLDSMITISPKTDVTFLRLTMLMGG